MKRLLLSAAALKCYSGDGIAVRVYLPEIESFYQNALFYIRGCSLVQTQIRISFLYLMIDASTIASHSLVQVQGSLFANITFPLTVEATLLRGREFACHLRIHFSTPAVV